MIVEPADFQRYELQCYCCGKIVGYMSAPFGGSDNKVVTSTYDAHRMPVCCPSCEETMYKHPESLLYVGGL